MPSAGLSGRTRYFPSGKNAVGTDKDRQLVSRLLKLKSDEGGLVEKKAEEALEE